MFWKPEAMAISTRGGGVGGRADDLDGPASLFDLLFGRSRYRGRLDRELLGEIALAEDLQVRMRARHHPGALQQLDVHRTAGEPLLERPDVDGEDLLAEGILEPLLR